MNTVLVYCDIMMTEDRNALPLLLAFWTCWILVYDPDAFLLQWLIFSSFLRNFHFPRIAAILIGHYFWHLSISRQSSTFCLVQCGLPDLTWVGLEHLSFSITSRSEVLKSFAQLIYSKINSTEQHKYFMSIIHMNTNRQLYVRYTGYVLEPQSFYSGNFHWQNTIVFKRMNHYVERLRFKLTLFIVVLIFQLLRIRLSLFDSGDQSNTRVTIRTQ